METKREYFEDISSVRRKALKSYNKTEDDLEEDIQIIKRWLKTQPHLPEIATDKVITSFLMMNKFSIEKTKTRLDMYYTMRSLFPEFFVNRHPLSPHMLDAMDTLYFLPLQKATKKGERVYIFRMPHKVEHDVDVDIWLALQYNAYEYKLQADYQVGDILVFDLENIGINLLSKVTPTIMKKASTILEKTYNSRVNQMHFLNVYSYAEPLLSIAISFLNKKIANRVHFHKDKYGLAKFIPADILPKDFGGKERSLQELNEIFKQELAAHKERFAALEKLRVNEALRPTPLINDEVLGFYGNFKKLSVD